MKLSSITSYRCVWSVESWKQFPNPYLAQFSTNEHIMQKLHCMLIREPLVVKILDVDNDWSMKSLERGVLGDNMMSQFQRN